MNSNALGNIKNKINIFKDDSIMNDIKNIHKENSKLLDKVELEINKKNSLLQQIVTEGKKKILGVKVDYKPEDIKKIQKECSKFVLETTSGIEDLEKYNYIMQTNIDILNKHIAEKYKEQQKISEKIKKLKEDLENYEEQIKHINITNN